jgi:hypothetical protein
MYIPMPPPGFFHPFPPSPLLPSNFGFLNFIPSLHLILLTSPLFPSKSASSWPPPSLLLLPSQFRRHHRPLSSFWSQSRLISIGWSPYPLPFTFPGLWAPGSGGHVLPGLGHTFDS